MKVLVFGGRDYTDREAVFRALDRAHAKRAITLVIHGDARGADKLAGAWARERGIPERAFPANWDRDKRAAGPIRNRLMFAEGAPDNGIGFPGGSGTRDMASVFRDARRKGVSAARVWWPEGGNPFPEEDQCQTPRMPA